jgi:hypothetical protein
MDQLILPPTVAHTPPIDELVRLLNASTRPLTVYLFSPRAGAPSNSPAKRLRTALGSTKHKVCGYESFPALGSLLIGWDKLASVHLFSQPELDRATDALFQATITRTEPVFGWHATALFAETILSLPHWSEVERWKLTFTRDVAHRHCGINALLPWPQNNVLAWIQQQGLELEVIANIIQSAADKAPDQVHDFVQRAQQLPVFASAKGTAGYATLLGAIGRAYASTRQYNTCISYLREAISTWTDLNNRPETSYPLCEYLRVQGILKDRQAVTTAIQTSVKAFFDSHPEEESAGFVRLAVGRSLAQVDAYDDAVAELCDDADWPAAVPEHARRARLRWLHYAAFKLDNTTLADIAMDQLREMGDSDQVHLACLDLALHQRADFQTHSLSVLNVPIDGAEARNLARSIAPALPVSEFVLDRDLVEKLAWEYRY